MSDSETASAGRITVNLIRQAAGALDLAVAREGRSKTDIVNRALTAYEYTTRQLAAGKVILVRDEATGETQRVQFI